MSKICDFCHESIPDEDSECPFCGEVNGLPGCTRHYFHQYFLRVCPLCEFRPLLKADRSCPKCNVNLHRFSLEWGFNLPHSESATRLARRLEKTEKPPGVVWEHLERKGRICVAVDIGADRHWAFSFGHLCMCLTSLRGTECRHAGRLCRLSLPQEWIRCFFGYRKPGEEPEKLRDIAFEHSDWRGQY